MIIGFPGGKLVGATAGAIIGFVGLMRLAVYLTASTNAAVNDARNIIPLTQALPPMLGDPPSSAYPGSTANGWTPTAIQTYRLVPAAGGCIEHAAVLSAFVTRTYYYNNSTTLKGNDQASMTIDVYVEPSDTAASLAQAQVPSQRYQACYAKHTTALLNMAGMQVTKATTVSPLLIDAIFPGVSFESTSRYRANNALLPYYDATAVVRYGRYRAIVDIGRCCQIIPLYTLQNTVDLVEQRLQLAPEHIGASLFVVLALAVLGAIGDLTMAGFLIGYSKDARRRRMAIEVSDSKLHWTAGRSRNRRDGDL